MQLTIERLSSEQEQEFRISSALQIQSLLRDLLEKRALAALYYDGARDFILTSLLDVGDEGFWVEQGVDEPKNRRVAESRRITLVSLLEQVKIQFAVDEIQAVAHQGYPAFYLPRPASIYRLQHREYYRLTLSPSERLHCLIPTGESHEDKKEVPITDISVGGMRLFCTDNDIEFVLGQTYAGCQIDLPGVGKIIATITVKSAVLVSPKPGQTAQSAGCEFRNLDNASGVLLQRYVTMKQRSRAAGQ